MHEGRGLESLAWPLVVQFLRGQLPQFIVDQGQKLLCRRRVAGLELRENASNFGHSLSSPG